MVLTKEELIGSLQNEVRILQHLCTKIDRSMIDYRPTPKQRSTIELLRYLSNMGPGLVQAAKTGTFDPAAWTEATKTAEARDFDQTVAYLATHADMYAKLIGPMTEADFRETDQHVRHSDVARIVHRQSRAGRLRRVSHADLPLPEGVWPRGAQHVEPLGRRRSTGRLKTSRAGKAGAFGAGRGFEPAPVPAASHPPHPPYPPYPPYPPLRCD